MENFQCQNNQIFIILPLLGLLALMVFAFTKNSGKYHIRKRMNFSGFWFLKIFLTKQIPFQVRIILNDSCKVQTLGIQKIFGMGDLYHHKNSDRYGFTYDGYDTFTIYSYQYINGNMSFTILGNVKTNEPFFIMFDENITNKYKIGRYLFPYFEQDGDDEKGAPHKMTIDIMFAPIDIIGNEPIFKI